MIGRLGHGWTSRENADAYEALLRDEVLPGNHRVRAFAGEDYEKAVAPPEARRLLSRFDERSTQYRSVLERRTDRPGEKR